MATEETQAETKGGVANLRPWQPGQSGNPAGRPKGARSKLGEAFVDALLADWQKNGVEAIIKMRDEKAADYVKVIASILPKELSGPDGEPLAFNKIEMIPVKPE